MRLLVTGMLVLGGLVSLGFGRGSALEAYEITFTNLTHGVLLTPPIVSLSRQPIEIFKAGEPASLGVAMVAEGGNTDELRNELEAAGAWDLIQTSQAVMPGESITVRLSGPGNSFINLASMLLPTNDGFVALNGDRIQLRSGEEVFYLRSYDAGSELNDELCASIPGPQCGGAGYNPADGEGHVAPHAGIHGEGDLSRAAYNWGEPVARVTVRRAN